LEPRAMVGDEYPSLYRGDAYCRHVPDDQAA
jgi:hypothetical protein